MPVRDFRRVAIVNRGEPAMRLINAVREFNHERGADLKTIALYTEPDACAMFVREADEAYSLGTVTFRDDADGQIKNRYLDYATLERALRETGAEAAWVGWGFVAEHARFADLCDNLGVTFIGPPGDVIRQLGDKITSKKLAETARVPVAPWSGGSVDNVDDALHWGRKIGYPLVLKATAGGGGRGIRKLRSEEELAPAYESAKNEALRAFGDGTMFMEKMVTGARHIEVQLIADHYGTVWPLGIRDCSLQRNNQKVVEESSSTELRPEQEEELKAAAARLGATVGYRNAGTVEFLYDPSSEGFSFMEVNARLQVEHPVTELTTGADLVKMQIAMAMGESLEGTPPPSSGHAVEVRLCAEDPASGFMPAPGQIERFRVPAGPGVRVDTGFEEGDEI
ncbi:MAG: biotin carboxylase N-terminal domain-containing protein, partial [Myxococcota bacterium]